MKLTDQQLKLVELVTSPSSPPLACLTGGPGTGKTTALRAVLERACAYGMRAICAAPSGKAAQRMEEATGRPSSTLHRLLKIMPAGDSLFGEGEGLSWQPVFADLLVIDEASMIDVELLAATLAAARAGRVRTVLLVGDADQLPPVEPGQPYADLLAGEVCPTVRLTEVHRQETESGIVRAATAIREGREPELDREDFRLVPCEGLADVPAVVWDTIRSAGLHPETSQVLAPQRTTKGGADAINDMVERARRPLEGEHELVRGKFRAGTKVINKRNDYERMIFNGDLGEVLDARSGGESRRSADELHVQIAGARHVFRGAAIASLRPAWALTVHSSQGSQWEDVIVVAHRAHTHMLTRRLLYVAATRASERVWIVGQREAVSRAVANTRDARRDTWLGRRFALDRRRSEEAHEQEVTA